MNEIDKKVKNEIIVEYNQYMDNVLYNEAKLQKELFDLNKTQNIKVIFMGTPEFSIPTLKALIENTNVIAVVTQPDKKVGRKQILTETPIKVLAKAHNIPVFQPEKLKEITDELIALEPDFIITCAYGQIVPEDILAIPKYYPLNVHASLLPKYRGAAPIQYAIMNNDTVTGITIMEMEKGLDSGGIFSQILVPIRPYDNLKTMHDKLSISGAELLIPTLKEIVEEKLKPEPQDESKVTLSPKITKEDELIDWNQDSVTVFNHIRALNPVPGAYTDILDKNIKIYDATYEIKETGAKPGMMIEDDKTLTITTTDGVIIIKTLQVAGKKKITALDYINSNR